MLCVRHSWLEFYLALRAVRGPPTHLLLHPTCRPLLYPRELFESLRERSSTQGHRQAMLSTTVVHPCLPTYQYGSWLRRAPPPDDLKLQTVGRPISAMAGGPTQRSPFTFQFSDGGSDDLNSPLGIPAAKRRAQSATKMRYVQLPGRVRGSEISVKRIDTWIPRTMPPIIVPTPKSRTPTIGFRPITPADYAFPAPFTPWALRR